MGANAPLSPDTIQQLTGGVAPPLAMLAGMQLDVFSPLADNLYRTGASYTEAEHVAWLAACGCVDPRRVVLPTGSTIIWATKAG